MPYVFANGEAVDRAVQRCAAEQLDLAIAQLGDGVKTDPVTAVHEARKALKKVRSLLRLARGTLSASERRRMNRALRDIGRRLSPARDAEVMLQAVDALSEHYAGQLPKTTFNAIKRHLGAQAKPARDALTNSGLIAEVLEELKAQRLSVDQWALRRGGWQAIGDGLRQSYKRGRRAYRTAARKPKVENLHEWRKRGKDLWYHTRLLEPISPGIMNGQAKESHHLSDLLGDDHDLAVLRQELLSGGARIPVDVDSVITLIDHRRDQLEAEAMLVGARLYAEKPGAFMRRMHRYWKASQSHTQAEAGETHRPVHLPGRTRAAAAVV
jgi:CHAD domain-containing protein